jgi:ABC-type transporter Mla MlaB component
MPFFLTKQGGRQLLRLEGDVTIRDARKLAAMLGEKLDRRLPVEVDTARLEDIDTCILQLLCSVGKTAPEVAFGDPGELFLNALERSQLRRALLGAREAL